MENSVFPNLNVNSLIIKERILGGYNSTIYRAIINSSTIKNVKCVIKQVGYEPDENSSIGRMDFYNALKIIYDYIDQNQLIKTFGILSPKIFGYSIVPDNFRYKEVNKLLFKNFTNNPNHIFRRIVIIESFCGKSIVDILRSNINRKKHYKYFINKIRNILYSIPKEFEIDSNPKNFTYSNGNIYYVDFTPPKFKGYQNIQLFNEIFPTIMLRDPNRERRRIWRYTTPEGRFIRFKYYLNKFINL